MQVAKQDYNLDEVFYRKKHLELHQKKLELILAEKREEQGFERRRFISGLRENKSRINQFKEKLKHTLIQRENDILLTKLLDIQTRQPNQNSPASRSLGAEYNMTALKHHKNFVQMKNDVNKVVKYNAKMAQRIISQEATIKHDELERDYQKSRQYKKTIVRYTPQLDLSNQMNNLRGIAYHFNVEKEAEKQFKGTVPAVITTSASQSERITTLNRELEGSWQPSSQRIFRIRSGSPQRSNKEPSAHQVAVAAAMPNASTVKRIKFEKGKKQQSEVESHSSTNKDEKNHDNSESKSQLQQQQQQQHVLSPRSKDREIQAALMVMHSQKQYDQTMQQSISTRPQKTQQSQQQKEQQTQKKEEQQQRLMANPKNRKSNGNQLNGVVLANSETTSKLVEKYLSGNADDRKPSTNGGIPQSQQKRVNNPAEGNTAGNTVPAQRRSTGVIRNSQSSKDEKGILRQQGVNSAGSAGVDIDTDGVDRNNNQVAADSSAAASVCRTNSEIILTQNSIVTVTEIKSLGSRNNRAACGGTADSQGEAPVTAMTAGATTSRRDDYSDYSSNELDIIHRQHDYQEEIAKEVAKARQTKKQPKEKKKLKKRLEQNEQAEGGEEEEEGQSREEGLEEEDDVQNGNEERLLQVQKQCRHFAKSEGFDERISKWHRQVTSSEEYDEYGGDEGELEGTDDDGQWMQQQGDEDDDDDDDDEDEEEAEYEHDDEDDEEEEEEDEDNGDEGGIQLEGRLVKKRGDQSITQNRSPGSSQAFNLTENSFSNNSQSMHDRGYGKGQRVTSAPEPKVNSKSKRMKKKSEIEHDKLRMDLQLEDNQVKKNESKNERLKSSNNNILGENGKNTKANQESQTVGDEGYEFKDDESIPESVIPPLHFDRDTDSVSAYQAGPADSKMYELSMEEKIGDSFKESAIMQSHLEEEINELEID